MALKKYGLPECVCIQCQLSTTEAHVSTTSDILVLKLISVLVFILFSSHNFYFI